MTTSERKKEYMKEYFLRDYVKEKERIRQRKYREQNKEKISEKNKKYNKNNKDKIAEYSKEYAQKHKDRISKNRKLRRAKEHDTVINIERNCYQKHKDKRATYKKSFIFAKRYGIKIEDYNKILDNQNGKCAICERHVSDFNRLLAVDHNHKTGKVRGLLCFSCNVAIGNFKDSIDILRKAVKYLEDNDE